MSGKKVKSNYSKIFELYAKYGQKSFLFTLVCIVWLVWRVSTKPTRLNYPCSQFAIWQITLYFGSISTPLISICHKCISYIRQKEYVKIAGITLIVLVLTATFNLYAEYADNQLRIAGSGTIPASSSAISSPAPAAELESISRYPEFPQIISPDSAVVSFNYDPLIDYGGTPPFDSDFNPAYDFVWETVARLQLGSSINPLDDLIDEGDTVLIKPNWVDYGPAVYTRPEVVRPLIDMAIAAGATEIYIGDGGTGVPDVNYIINNAGYGAMTGNLTSLHPGITIETVNLCSLSNGWHWISLSENSSFAGANITHAQLGTGTEMLYNHQYYNTPDPQAVNPEGDTLGWYAVNDIVLDADVIINTSKMKTHQLMMATMSIKNLVGCTISCTYNQDTMTMARIAHHPYPTGTGYNYFENDIFWRAILDMNKILLYTDENGVLQPTQQRKYLNVVDGIQAMERSQHHEYGLGIRYDRHVILAGVDPAAVDAVGCRIMGYDYSVIPSIGNADSDSVHPIGTNDPEKIVVIGDEIDSGINHVFEFNSNWADDAVTLNMGLTDFTPPSINIIDREGTTVTANISDCLAAYILYLADGLDYIEKMTKDGDIYTGSISSTTSEFQIIAQDEYFNTVQSEPQTIEDTTPPYTSGYSPVPGATDVPVDTNIVVHVLDEGDGVDIDTIAMTVEGISVTPDITGTTAEYILTYNPPVDFALLQVVDVSVNASDLASPANAMTPETYSFTTAQEEYTLTVNINGNGTVDRDDPGPYNYGDPVQLTAVPDSGWSFTDWSDDLSGSTNPEIITMDGNKTVTASFSQDTYTLTVNIVGSGSVSLDPAGGSYLSGTVVELTANATSGWAFGGWSGNVSTVENVTLASTIITMNDDYTITANFAQPILTMVVSGSGNVTPAVGSHVYDSGSTVNVTATPSAGWRFVSWTGDVSTVENVTLASTTITMDEDYTITANFVSIEQNGGGGGGGGGSGGDITHLNEYTTSTGKFVSDATACSADGLVEIEIPKDTVGKDRNGNRLRYISIKKQKTPSDPPADCEFVCLTYNIGPSGATLGPFGYLVFHYNDSEVPEGVAEENLILATWQDGAWVGLEGCIVNPDENTITAPVSHFSFFTAMAHMAPASFEVSGMTVTPDEIQPHESVTVSLTLTNTGDLTGSYTVILEINGAAVQDKVVTLKGSENRVVSFTVTQETDGEYTVSVGSLTDSFTVKEAEGEVVDISEVGTPEPTPAPTPTSRPVETLAKPTQPAVEPAPTAQSPVEPTTSRGIAWWLIVIYAVAGVIIVGLGFYFFVRWRSTAV